MNMKKFLILAALLLGFYSLGAQNRYYVCGDVSFGIGSNGTRIVVYPEVGTRIADNLYAGIAAGFDWYDRSGTSDFTMGVTPHLRGYLPLYGRFGLMGDAFLSGRFTRRKGYDPLIKTLEAGLRPGLFFPVGNVTLTTRIGFLGFIRTDYGNGSVNSGWHARLQANDVLIGVLVNI